jgi:glycosyltransferase involved in cell wall biosynthesis
MRFGLIVTNLRGGGAEKAMCRIGELLARRGHEVHLILLEHLLEHEPPPGVALHALTADGTRQKRTWLGRRIASLRLRRMVTALERGKRLDLIVSTLPFADGISLRARLRRHWCRIANTLSAEVAREAQLDVGKARRRRALYRRRYRGKSLIAVSDGVARDLVGELGVAAARVETIVNPIDVASIRALARQPAPLPTEPYVIHVGRFVAFKRHDLLFEAWCSVPDAPRLVLLARREPALDSMIRHYGLESRVSVMGFQQNPYPWIAGAKLLVLCSDHEGMPNVLVEALACGTPVVATDCPSGPREVLGRDAPDWLVPTGDAAKLAEAIGRVLAGAGDAARVDLSRFAPEAVAERYERLAAEP